MTGLSSIDLGHDIVDPVARPQTVENWKLVATSIIDDEHPFSAYMAAVRRMDPEQIAAIKEGDDDDRRRVAREADRERRNWGRKKVRSCTPMQTIDAEYARQNFDSDGWSSDADDGRHPTQGTRRPIHK